MNIATTIVPAAVPIWVSDAFTLVASLADDLPGWCDQTDPVARTI